MFTQQDNTWLESRKIKLIAVTKNRSVQEIVAMIERLHPFAIAENRWQEAKANWRDLESPLRNNAQPIEKHFIGHIQTNKAKQIVQAFDFVQSVDSIRVAEVMDREAAKQHRTLRVLLQVNVSSDPNKYGFAVEDTAPALQHIRLHCVQLNVQGIMTITAQQDDFKTQQDFRRMKELQRALRLPEVSMGMSRDWRMAAEEGATMVRIGRALFE